ncbi:MAG: SAM-dependent methyltransferase [Bryobacterales bacterium]|nr:SAM-dependent methyltransferase [Bryobacterales bacterium]
MTPLAEILRDEIRGRGPVGFARFMEAALYHPEHGYYRRDPFGKDGDFYTAAQVQPVFGLLVRRAAEDLLRGVDPPLRVADLGAGRREMADAFAGLGYLPIDVDDAFPEDFRGLVFANEFFDALPVSRAVQRGGVWREALVTWADGTFCWTPGPPVDEETAAWIHRYFPAEARSVEIPRAGLDWIAKLARCVTRGSVWIIDYGYTSREAIRFPDGTLMSYRRHVALEDVLAEPGRRDITAHVCFTALEDAARGHGFSTLRFESLASALLRAGEADEFAGILDVPDAAARRLQLKTLLFGMGESFRSLVLVTE